LGIIRDSETGSPQSALQAVCAALKSVGLRCPERLADFTTEIPRTGVFILPDCQQAGMLETLCWSVLEHDPKSKPQLDCVKAYTECLRGAGTTIRNEAKAKVWAYLAGTFHDPQVGRAAQCNVWDWTSPVFQPLTQFLRAL